MDSQHNILIQTSTKIHVLLANNAVYIFGLPFGSENTWGR